MKMKEELRFVLEEDGEQYVMILGTIVMQRLCVGNLEWEAQVKWITDCVACVSNKFMIYRCNSLRWIEI